MAKNFDAQVYEETGSVIVVKTSVDFFLFFYVCVIVASKKKT